MGIVDSDLHPGAEEVFLKGLPQAVCLAPQAVADDGTSSDLDHKEQLDREQSYAAESVELDAYRARTMNRRLARDIDLRSISLCGLGKICVTVAPPKNGPSNRHIAVWQAEKIEFGGRTKAGRVHVSDTALRCKNSVICPVCAPKNARQRSEVLRPQILKYLSPSRYFKKRAELRAALADEYQEDPGEDFDPGIPHDVYMVTLTARHHLEDDCSWLLDRQSDAFRKAIHRMTKKQARGNVRPMQYVAALDATDNFRTGFHNHIHVLLLVPVDHGDTSATAEELLLRWMDACDEVGLECDRSGQHFFLAAKAPVKPGEEPDAPDLEAIISYVVHISLPKARSAAGSRSGNARATMPPMQHLYLACDEGLSAKQRSYHGRRWQEYMRAMSRRRVIRTSTSISMKPVKGKAQPLEKLIELPDHFARVLDEHRAWRPINAALINAYMPDDAPPALDEITRVMQDHGIGLSHEEIVSAIAPRMTRLPENMSEGYVPDRPLTAVPEGFELIALTENRIQSFFEFARHPGTGWDPVSLDDWLDSQLERLDQRLRRLERQNEFDEEFGDPPSSDADCSVVEPW